MKPPHRIRIYSQRLSVGRLWYVTCKCGWQVASETYHHSATGGVYLRGRKNWDTAFGLGVAHLREKACTHV